MQGDVDYKQREWLDKYTQVHTSGKAGDNTEWE